MTSNALRLPVAALAALVALGAAPSARAQDDTSQLPSLTPRVFESRGTITVNLPDIQRQPLSGFGPPPRTYVVPAERDPVSQPFTPDLDALPVVALAPPPEPVSDLDAPRGLRAEGGAGAQLSRYGRFDLSTTGAAGLFFVDAAYDGISGQDNDGRVHFDRLDVTAGGQSFSPGRLRLQGHALLDGYRVPEVGFDNRRRRRALGAEAGFGGVGALPYDVTVRFEQSTFRVGDADEVSEGRLDGQARVGLLGDRLRFDAAGGIAGAGGVGTDAQYGAVGASAVFGRADGARLVVGVRGLAYEASAGIAGGGNGQRLGPILDLQVPIGPALQAFATNDPRLAVRSLADLTELNRYLAPDPLSPVVIPDMLQIDARGGLELRRGPARLRGYVTALRAPTYLVFNQLGDEYAESYVRASSYGVGGDATVATAGGVSMSAGVEARTSSADGSGDIPYYAPLVGRAGLQVPFAQGRGRVGVSAYGESQRPTGGLGDAPAFGLVSFDASYDVTGPFSAVLRGERLVGEAERWPGYPQVPYAVMLGLRFSR